MFVILNTYKYTIGEEVIFKHQEKEFTGVIVTRRFVYNYRGTLKEEYIIGVDEGYGYGQIWDVPVRNIRKNKV